MLPSAEREFPGVRMGGHWSELLYREGDYVGAAVNLASRVAAEAGAHELLVTAALRDKVGDLADVEFVSVGPRALKGIRDEVELFAARSTRSLRRERVVDPVCGMELDPAEAPARLDIGSETLAFCSTECLQRYVAAPGDAGLSSP